MGRREAPHTLGKGLTFETGDKMMFIPDPATFFYGLPDLSLCQHRYRYRYP
jgi:hypothetical protein